MNLSPNTVRGARTRHPDSRDGHLPRIGVLALALGIAVAGTACQQLPKSSIAWGGIATQGGAGSGPRDIPGSDRDKDSVTDDRERALGSNPDNADSDGDGFPDGFEDRLSDFGFDLTKPDADRDRDGLPDRREAELGTDPGSPDSDGDGWGDFDEVLNRYFGFDPVKKTADRDFDGLADELEARLGSSPTNPDSNGDGIGDFAAYDADQSPTGPNLQGGLGELIGATYSEAMGDALRRIRDRGVERSGAFPEDLARQLPYPDVTAPLLGEAIRPSAALMQRSLYNPHNSPGLYKTYAEIEQDLFKLADTYDGSPGPKLVRLFYWTGQTQDTCDGRESKGGRKIYAVKVSADPDENGPEPEVAFLGVHHARELITGVQTMELLRTLTDGYATDSDIRKLVDERETWVIPVVNPNGYERAVASQVSWRKNARWDDKAKQDPGRCGIDINRNYGFEHVASFPPAQRKTLPDVGYTGVDTSTGNLVPDSDTYPGLSAFSEVETQAVRGLAHSQFATRKRKEVDGLVCMLSWHSYGGVVGHPMGHVAIPPNTNLDPPDVAPYNALTQAMADASAYTNIKDTYPSLTTIDGCGYPGYAVYGDSNDWFYKDGDTFSVLIESYSVAERGACPSGSNLPFSFYPQDAAKRDAVAKSNVQAALAMLRTCPP